MGSFAFMDFVMNYFSAEDIYDQIEIIELTFDGSSQVSDVPAPNLVGGRGDWTKKISLCRTFRLSTMGMSRVSF